MRLDYKGVGKIGITCSTFDFLHAGHIVMLEEAKRHCDYLIAALQVDPTIDREEKNYPVQSIVERQIQLAGVKFVDEIVMYNTEKDLEDLFLTLPLDVRIIGATNTEVQCDDRSGHADWDDLIFSCDIGIFSENGNTWTANY